MKKYEPYPTFLTWLALKLDRNDDPSPLISPTPQPSEEAEEADLSTIPLPPQHKISPTPTRRDARYKLKVTIDSLRGEEDGFLKVGIDDPTEYIFFVGQPGSQVMESDGNYNHLSLFNSSRQDMVVDFTVHRLSGLPVAETDEASTLSDHRRLHPNEQLLVSLDPLFVGE